MTDTQEQTEEYAQRFCTDQTFRRAVLGTSVFTSDLAHSLCLSSRILALGLRILHRTIVWLQPDFGTVDRQLLGAAAILLSWKLLDDTGRSRNTRKLPEVARAVYRLLAVKPPKIEPMPPADEMMSLEGEEEEEGELPLEEQQHPAKKSAGEFVETAEERKKKLAEICSKHLAIAELLNPATPEATASPSESPATKWPVIDGNEHSRVKDVIRSLETAILHALDFTVEPETSVLDVARERARVVWRKEVDFRRKWQKLAGKESYLLMEDQLLRRLCGWTESFLIDFYKAPFCLLWRAEVIADAAVWKAAAIAGFAFPFASLTAAALEKYGSWTQVVKGDGDDGDDDSYRLSHLSLRTPHW